MSVFFIELNSQSVITNAKKIDTPLSKFTTQEFLVDSFSIPIASSDLKSKLEYEAEDSIVFDNIDKRVYLYRNSKVDYDAIKVNAYYIQYDWTSRIMNANRHVGLDSISGKPLMTQDGKSYLSDKISYNFGTQKGKIYNIVTQEGEGIIHGQEVKKDSLNNWYVKNAKYTTCDLEHPHFHFEIKRLKMIPDKSMISGPANLQINGVPTPLILPFGFFPLQKGRRSGILLPQEYGFAPVFNLRGLGYYWAINDRSDLTVRSQVYFNGSYDLRGDFRYISRYLYSGNFMVGTNRIFIGDSDDPSVKANTPTQYIFSWQHAQDPKAHPTFNFNSNINYQTQSYNQNPTNNTERRINSQISSTLSISKKFRYLPIDIRSSINYTQDLATKRINGQFPNIQLNYFGNPFKSPSGRGYLNQLSVQHTSEFNSQFNTYDSLLLSKQFFNELKYGMQHRLNLNFGTIKLFKYFNLAPSVNYTDRFLFNRIIKAYDSSTRQIVDRRENGFYTLRDFSGSLNLSTVIYGIKEFRNGGLRGLRHQITPNIGMSFSPNFNSDFWGYYRTIDTGNNPIRYSPYQNSIYQVPGGNANVALNFGISNALEGKFRNRKDSINPIKKIPLIDVLSINGSYLLSNDSFKLSNIDVGMTNTLNQFLNLRLSLSYNPYLYQNNRRIDRYLLSEGKGFIQLENANATLNLNLNSTNVKSKIINSQKGTPQERQYLYQNYHLFYDFDNPWNLSAAINFSANNNLRLDTTTYNASLAINNLDLTVTKNWKIGIQTGYDFVINRVTRTTISAVRNMHCWEFRFNYTPILVDFSGRNTPAYSIEIRPKAALLQDLKLMRNKPALDNYF